MSKGSGVELRGWGGGKGQAMAGVSRGAEQKAAVGDGGVFKASPQQSRQGTQLKTNLY